MIDPILALLTVQALALIALGTAAAWLGPRARQGIGLGGACLVGFGCLMVLVWLLLEATPVYLTLPLGPPHGWFTLVLDPLAAVFLLPVLVSGAAAIAFAAETGSAANPATLAGMLSAQGGFVLALLAGDGALLALGLGIAALALHAAGARPDRGAGLPGGMLLAGLAVLGTEALSPVRDGLGPLVTDDAERGAVGLLLVLAGSALLAGWAPVVAARQDLPARTAALLTGAAVPVAACLVLRLLFGPVAAPAWWAVPFVTAGGTAMLLGGWSAARQPDLGGVIGGLILRLVGLSGIGVGVSLLARTADLPDLGLLALGTTVTAVVAASLCGTLAMLAASGVRDAAGSAALLRLGGLIHRMPVTAAALLLALVGLAALPPGLGFAAAWLAVQALLALPPAGGPLPGLVPVALFAVLALSGGLALVAVLRLFGVAFLGRPRGPRASAAEEVPTAARPILLALAGVATLLGVLPGVLPSVLADPALHVLVGTHAAEGAAAVTLRAAVDGPGYAPLPLVMLAALVGGIALLALRRPVAIEQERPVWADGFAPSPPWLPFGDPTTQTDGADFVPAVLPHRLARRSWRLPRRQWRLRRVGRSRGAATWLLPAGVALLVLAVAWRGVP